MSYGEKVEMKMNLQTWAVESLGMGDVQNIRGSLYNLHLDQEFISLGP